MRQVFGDTSYWVALANPKDQWNSAARKASAELGPCVIVTTDEVLTEFLNFLCEYGAVMRSAAGRFVDSVFANNNVRVIPQSRDSFFRGLELYTQRLDKGYSLTDCVSMTVMRSQGLTEVLTNDQHFAQEGFTVLVK